MPDRRCFRLLLAACVTCWASFVATADAATIRFKPSATVEATIVTLGDVADVVDGDAEQLARLRSVQLVPAPAPGRSLRLEFGTVRSRLQAHGVNLTELEFSGRSVVEVRRVDAAVGADDGLATPAADQPDWKQQRAKRLVAEAIREHCRRQAPELGVVQVAVELEPDDVERVVAAGGLTIAVPGAAVPPAEPQPLLLRLVDRTGTSEELRVTAGVTPWPWVLAAKEGVPQGQRLQLADLAWVQVETADALFTSVEQIVGQETAQPIRAGQPVRAGDVRSVPLIRNGDIITVASRRAGILVRRPMKARGDGALGDEITVTTLDGRERLSARVTGFHEAEVGSQVRTEAPAVLDSPTRGLRIITDTTENGQEDSGAGK